MVLPGQTISYSIAPNRHLWVHVVRGEANVGGNDLSAGDAAAVSGENEFTVSGLKSAEVLLFDLA